MVYLDANVFVFALMARDELGDSSRRILGNLEKIKAKTCCLTLDELAWAVLRATNTATAVEACKAVLRLRDLDIASVEYGDVWMMTENMKTFDLRPRDAIHLAVMKRLGEKTIVSEDIHFDKADVERFNIKAFADSL
ncbi:MAG: type II toxin-antitoxin system VapC family toxin [Candidatus Bathyarchaeia archaeon]